MLQWECSRDARKELDEVDDLYVWQVVSDGVISSPRHLIPCDERASHRSARELHVTKLPLAIFHGECYAVSCLNIHLPESRQKVMESPVDEVVACVRLRTVSCCPLIPDDVCSHVLLPARRRCDTHFDVVARILVLIHNNLMTVDLRCRAACWP